MIYDDNRYEVEAKYTQFVVLASRPTWPRLDMAPLAAVLNKFEDKFRSIGRSDTQPELVWVSNSFTDTGWCVGVVWFGVWFDQCGSPVGVWVWLPARLAHAWCVLAGGSMVVSVG